MFILRSEGGGAQKNEKVVDGRGWSQKVRVDVLGEAQVKDVEVKSKELSEESVSSEMRRCKIPENKYNEKH